MSARQVTHVLIGLQVMTALVTGPLYARVGLTIAWGSLAPKIVILGLLASAAWWTRNDRDGIAHLFIAIALLGTGSALLASAQYLAVTTHRPLIDQWLAGVDTRLGFSVPAIVGWTQKHRWFVAVLRLAYQSLLPQFALPILILGAIRRQPDRLSEYLWHFHICAIVTVGCLALWPAEGVFTYTGTPSLLPQARFISHFNSLRAGTFHVIQLDNLEGLITVPSFHMAGAWMVTWSLRGTRALLPLLVLNVLLVISTVALGAHYAVDPILTAPLCFFSVVSYRLLRRSTARLPAKSSPVGEQSTSRGTGAAAAS